MWNSGQTRSASTPPSFRSASSPCIAGSAHSPRWSARSLARVIGRDRIVGFVVAKNEAIVYTSYANQERYSSKYRYGELEAGSIYYLRVVQDDFQFAWSPTIWVETRPACPAIEAVAVVSEWVSSATDAGIPFARGSRSRLAVSPVGQSAYGQNPLRSSARRTSRRPCPLTIPEAKSREGRCAEGRNPA